MAQNMNAFDEAAQAYALRAAEIEQECLRKKAQIEVQKEAANEMDSEMAVLKAKKESLTANVDSIKQVEILSALREQMPNLPEVEPEQIAELRSIRKIADFFG